MRFLVAIIAMLSLAMAAPTPPGSYTNPILPGWHSDPSCVYVAEQDTVFCATSTFIAFPGLPIYASQDLKHWKLASNAFNRPSQIPDLRNTADQQGGIYAPTLRYRDGKFYLIVSFLGSSVRGLVFTTEDPYDDAAWSEPLEFSVRGIDPDIFWDEDGTVYVTSADNSQIQQYSLDLETGATGPVQYLWNGTGGVYPEGPHMFQKDGYYYLMIAEGGTELNHSETMARSRNRLGPWEPCPHNPILTNRNTTQYFQTVGHADLFRDGGGNWWAVALSTRSGPEWQNYPMGRETVLAPATWEEGEWPVIQPVRGQMQGPLPRADPHALRGKGEGGFVDEGDQVDFEAGSSIPAHWVYWRYPKEGDFEVSPPGHPNTLRLTPSTSNLTGTASFQPDEGISFVGRRQTDTLFRFSVDMDLRPQAEGDEAGVTLFLTQKQHVDLGMVMLQAADGQLGSWLRLRTEGRGNYEGALPASVQAIPSEWSGQRVRLEIRAVSEEEYEFSAQPVGRHGERVVLGRADARVVSGDTGRFTGTLVGVYATTNGGGGEGGGGKAAAHVGRWRYEGLGQKIN